jgi:DMSO reductase anchor subunit
MAVAGLVLGLWGISALSVTDSLVLFTLSAVLTVGMIVYLHSERRSHMERKSKAQESATAIATMAKFIADTLTLNYPPETLKALLNVPVKQLEDELKTLTAYVNALK